VTNLGVGIARFGLLVTVTLLWPGYVHAYPQWQISTGAVRCNQCHIAPAGGGLLSAQGRRVVGDDLSTFSGDGALLHGAMKLPGWLALGADLRGTFLVENAQAPRGTSPVAFPMEAEGQALLTTGDVSVYGTVGARGQAGTDDSIVPLQNYQPISTSWLVSREHWLMWQRGKQGLYLRAGRFFAPYGLRLADSVAYVRRDLGFNQLDESYNLSGGYLSDLWELHVTGFIPDLLRHLGSEETGVAAYLERRVLGGRAALAVQARYASRAGASRAIGGAVGKCYFAPIRTLLFTEVDMILLSVEGLPARGQAIAALGASVLPVRGLMLTALGEHYQEDIEVRGAARSAASLLVDWSPYAHVELRVMARAELPAGTDATKVLLAQLHYFL
jgi:hypothetical protein